MTKQRMTKLGLLGVAAILSSALAGPVMAKHAKHVISHPRHHAQNAACDPRDPGNPFSEKYDFLEWTAWRRRGGWDTRAEWTCQPIPEYARH
jgi:hypothetical protein